MKFKSGSLAVLIVFSATAHAQSSITLYGVLDSGLLYQSTSAATFLPNAPNLGHVYQLKDGGIYSSYWGLKGSEDIGSGYKITFRLQGTFNTTNGKFGLSDTPGATALFNQYATLGATGPFGTLDAGRQIVPMIYAMAETDVRGAQYFGSILTAWLGINQAAGWPGTSTNAPIGALYDSNALVYSSPKFYGTTLALEYAPGGVAGQFQGGTRESAVLKYSNYGLNLSAVYYNGHDTNPFPLTYPAAPVAPATGQSNNRFYYFGAMYTIRGFSVSASYAIARNPAKSNSVDFEMASGGLGYQFNPSFRITSGYYYLKDRNNSANHSSEFAVGAEYNLSLRTRAYAQVGYVNNKGTMNQTIVYGAPVAPGVSTTAAMVGIRHSF
ncbi:outer membrane protein (porin) [Burkholderia sp. Ch1-1]|uniref:Outer membrane protein (Porin) n=1 Tax=Paraburkholderia dioscoreae TaxID=2604047 RepID=A0A5Q4ZGW9_9BURK|nr:MULTISPECIES: porin [Paraburkholderia]EIF33478.1 outer membrane protein (porin) [Burkholderia sp. Ch1-1]MDR8395752.1 porin [Paraburkholderia sp. USG1]VVD32333.1 Outer membrane protein (Porin) [Paraburkholderia dioscoreae]